MAVRLTKYGRSLASSDDLQRYLVSQSEIGTCFKMDSRRQSICSHAAAAHFIERLLMIDPHHAGVPQKRKYRSLYVTPLTVEFKIDDSNYTFTILGVH